MNLERAVELSRVPVRLGGPKEEDVCPRTGANRFYLTLDSYYLVYMRTMLSESSRLSFKTDNPIDFLGSVIIDEPLVASSILLAELFCFYTIFPSLL